MTDTMEETLESNNKKLDQILSMCECIQADLIEIKSYFKGVKQNIQKELEDIVIDTLPDCEVMNSTFYIPMHILVHAHFLQYQYLKQPQRWSRC